MGTVLGQITMHDGVGWCYQEVIPGSTFGSFTLGEAQRSNTTTGTYEPGAWVGIETTGGTSSILNGNYGLLLEGSSDYECVNNSWSPITLINSQAGTIDTLGDGGWLDNGYEYESVIINVGTPEKPFGETFLVARKVKGRVKLWLTPTNPTPPPTNTLSIAECGLILWYRYTSFYDCSDPESGWSTPQKEAQALSTLQINPFANYDEGGWHDGVSTECRQYIYWVGYIIGDMPEMPTEPPDICGTSSSSSSTSSSSSSLSSTTSSGTSSKTSSVTGQ